MSDICSGPLVIIPNIDSAKFALSPSHLACHAGFALSNIKMNAEPITMKRPPSDELIGAVETKKVKLREDSERLIDELTTSDNKEKDLPIEKRVNGNSKSEDADSKQLSAENTSLCNGVNSKGIKTEDVNDANEIVSAKINNDIDDGADSTDITVENSEKDTPSKVNSCHESGNDNLDEAPTLEDIEISDESLNTSKGTNPCDISNSDVNISACDGATAPVDISDNVKNHSKTELELVNKPDLIVETPTLSTPSDVKNHTSDLIASKENELSCSKINSKILKEELAIKTPTMDESEIEKTGLKRTEENDAHVLTSSLDKKALEVTDGKIKSEKNVIVDSLVSDCNSENIPLNIDHTNSNKELCSDLIENEGNKFSNSSMIEGVELKTINDLANSDDVIIEDSESVKMHNNDIIKEISKEICVPVKDGEISSENSVIPVVIEMKKRDDSNVVGVSSSKLTDNVEDDENNPIVITEVTDSVDNDVKKEKDIISGNTDFVDEPSLAVENDKLKLGETDNDSKMDSSKRVVQEKSNRTQENKLKSIKPDDKELKNELDADEPVAKKIKLDDSSNDISTENSLNLKNVETTPTIKGIKVSESKEKDVKTQIINDSKLPTDPHDMSPISKEESKNTNEIQDTKEFNIEGTQSNNENAKVDCKDISTEILRKESDKPTENVIEEDSKKDDLADLDKMDVPSKQLENEKEFDNKESAIDNEAVCESNNEFENKESIEKSTDSVKLNENNEDSLVPNKLTTDAESVDSDIEILDDSAKRSDIVGTNASEKATLDGGEDVNVEKSDAITDVTEDTTLTADLRDTATPIEDIGDTSPIDVIRDPETPVDENDDTATPMDTDVAPSPPTVTAASADESSNDSMGLTIDYNEENKENVEEKDKADDAKTTTKEDDDEIIFIKECKKDDACTCVMCYAKNKTPEKSGEDKSDEKTADGEKDKKKKKKIKVPKLTDKFESLTRDDLEKVLSTMFLKVFTYESDLGQLRETVNKMKAENIAMKTVCTAQGKQLKELTHVHERAMAEITAFAADPKREGTLHPVKITRSVGLQVNVFQDKKRPSQPAADKNKASSPVTRSVNGITRPKRMVQRSSPYSSRGRTPNPSPSPSPQISPRLRGAITPNYRTARPMGVRPGLRILPPRALNNNMVANRGPWTSSPGRSPNTQVSPRQSPVVRLVTRAPAPVISNKTSGNTTVEFIDLDDDVQPASSPAPPKPPMRVVRAAPGTLVRTSTAATIRVATPTSIVSTNRTAVPGQRLYVPLSQGYKIRAAPNTNNAILTAPSSSAGNTNTTYVLNTPAGPIPFQTNNVRLNIRSNVNASPIRINYQGHPAPVPANVRPTMLPPEASYKIVPASPKLRVQLAQEGRGIQLTWSLDVTSDMAKIESYQLYAYQENKTAPINSSLWKSIGRLDALPLPMACTLTQFTSGHTYHFLVRAVDEFRRFSSFSNPGTIHLKS